MTQRVRDIPTLLNYVGKPGVSFQADPDILTSEEMAAVVAEFERNGLERYKDLPAMKMRRDVLVGNPVQTRFDYVVECCRRYITDRNYRQAEQVRAHEKELKLRGKASARSLVIMSECQHESTRERVWRQLENGSFKAPIECPQCGVASKAKDMLKALKLVD